MERDDFNVIPQASDEDSPLIGIAVPTHEALSAI
jgi:hypothetical protein